MREMVAMRQAALVRTIFKPLVLTLATVALLGSAEAAAAAPSGHAATEDSAARSPQPVRASSPAGSAASAIPGAQLWVRRYNGPTSLGSYATSGAVSPSGGTVFVTGYSWGARGGWP